MLSFYAIRKNLLCKEKKAGIAIKTTSAFVLKVSKFIIYANLSIPEYQNEYSSRLSYQPVRRL